MVSVKKSKTDKKKGKMKYDEVNTDDEDVKSDGENSGKDEEEGGKTSDGDGEHEEIDDKEERVEKSDDGMEGEEDQVTAKYGPPKGKAKAPSRIAGPSAIARSKMGFQNFNAKAPNVGEVASQTLDEGLPIASSSKKTISPKRILEEDRGSGRPKKLAKTEEKKSGRRAGKKKPDEPGKVRNLFLSWKADGD